MRKTSSRYLSQTLDTAQRRSARRQWECAFFLAGGLAAASFAPHPIVLPIVSALLVISASLAAGYAWLRSEGRTAGEFTRWDQAGILMFAGFLAALTGDSAETLQFIEAFVDVPPARE